MSFLHENSWMLFLVTEGITWMLVGLFFYCRYWLRYDRLSQFWLILVIIVNTFQILLGVIDFYFTGEISFFQIMIVLFITYGSTLGSSDFKRLDQFIKRKVDIHTKRIDRFEEQDTLDRHLPYRIGLFFAHTFAFMILHGIWYLLDKGEFNGLAEFSSLLANLWFHSIDFSFFSGPFYLTISYIWSLIYLFDLVVCIAYLYIWITWKVEGIRKR